MLDHDGVFLPVSLSIRLGRVLVLAMASLRFHMLPAVALNSLEEITNLYARCAIVSSLRCSRAVQEAEYVIALEVSPDCL